MMGNVGVMVPWSRVIAVDVGIVTVGKREVVGHVDIN